MAAPAFGTTGTYFNSVTSTPGVDVPDSVAAGDILVVYMFLDGDTTVTGLATDFAQAPDSPVSVNIGGSGQHRLYVVWKRATGADSSAGTYSFTLSASTTVAARAARYTGAVESGDPWDVTNSAQSGNTSVSTTPAVSDTTTVADTLLCWAATIWSGPAAPAWTPPTGFTERLDISDAHLTFADLAQAAAGATGSITGTCTSSDKSGAWLGALKPVTEGGGPTLMPRSVIVAG